MVTFQEPRAYFKGGSTGDGFVSVDSNNRTRFVEVVGFLDKHKDP